MRKLQERLDELSEIPSRIAAEVAEGISEELQGQFAGGYNAYGNPWEPLQPSTVKRKRGDTRILMRSDELAAETLARPTAGAGIEIASLPYGRFHQSGTVDMVARKILPDGNALPPSWQKRIQDALSDHFGRVLR